MNRFGENNPNWRGGKLVASNGYVLVRVGDKHHLSDVRGYAYEHRLVAEIKIGRRLKSGEEVHHINKIKTDNRPENIDVLPNKAVHHFRHRRPSNKNRKPGEKNISIKCSCGCGFRFYKFDMWGRPRNYISGHNLRINHGK